MAFAAVLVPRLFPENRLSAHQLLFFLTFTGYWAGTANGNPFGVLWSISVEELFYAVWPLLAKGGATRLRWVSALVAPLSLSLGLTQFDLWYNPLAHFLFFASGALVVLGHPERFPLWSLPRRVVCGGAGLACWTTIPTIFAVWPRLAVNVVGLLLVDLGCLLWFLAFFRCPLPDSRGIRALLYLGRISYGLYVFHLFCYRLVERFVVGNSGSVGLRSLLLTQAGTLALTITFASLSYQFWERPFLRWKERFTFVKSRQSSIDSVAPIAIGAST